MRVNVAMHALIRYSGSSCPNGRTCTRGRSSRRLSRGRRGLNL